MLLTETLEIEDRQPLRRVERPGQQSGNLLRDRSPLALGLHLQLLIQGVREILNVERSYLRFLHNASIMETLYDAIKCVMPASQGCNTGSNPVGSAIFSRTYERPRKQPLISPEERFTVAMARQ